MISNAVHFSMKLDQSMKSLFKTSITEMKNTTIIRKLVETFWRNISNDAQLMNIVFGQFSWTLVNIGVWNKFIDGQKCGIVGISTGAGTILHFHSEIHRSR